MSLIASQYFLKVFSMRSVVILTNVNFILLFKFSESFFFKINLFIYLFVYLFIYLFLAALGLHCCTWAFFSCIQQGLLFAVVRGLLIAVASFVAEHRL